MREVAIVQGVVWFKVLRIRHRSRILWKHDLQRAEIGLCWAIDRFLSKITPWLQANSTGKRITLLGRWMVGLYSSESCWDRPKLETQF